MSLVTYILLSALHSGVKDNFHPEVLGVTASKALGVVVLEFVAIKLGTYLLDLRGGVEGVSGSLEMVMYGGYKFVGWATLSLPSLPFSILMNPLSPSPWLTPPGSLSASSLLSSFNRASSGGPFMATSSQRTRSSSFDPSNTSSSQTRLPPPSLPRGP